MWKFLTPDTPVSTGVSLFLMVLPASAEIKMLINGALWVLTQAENWEQFGDLTPELAAELFSKILEQITETTGGGESMPICSMIPFCGNIVPDGWLECNGQVVSADLYPDLYAAINPAYTVSIDGVNFITLPDMRSRVPVGYDTPSWPIAFQGGEWEHQLTITEMPIHHHDIFITSGTQQGNYKNQAYTVARQETGQEATTSTGGGLAHNNMPPFHIVPVYIMKATN